MSKYAANLFLTKVPVSLGDLEAEMKKTLKGHMSGTWRKPVFNSPYGWSFDEVHLLGKNGPEIFQSDGFYWGAAEGRDRMSIPVEEFLNHLKPISYKLTAKITDAFLKEVIDEGEVLFPDGSCLSQGRFSYGPLAAIEKAAPSKFSRELLLAALSAGGKEAAAKTLRTAGALVLCEFKEAPQW